MILLDDSQSSAAKPSSRLYDSPLQSWCVLPSGDLGKDQRAIELCLAEIQQALQQGHFVVVTFAYELGKFIHQLTPRAQTSSHPLIEAWSFETHQTLSKEQVDAFLEQQLKSLGNEEVLAGVMDVVESITQEKFTEDIARIQEYIRNGDTYQINHTYRITGKTYGPPLALYSRLRKRQPGRFGAYIAQSNTNGNRYLLSQSPELFIQKQGEILKAMPMKGTANALSSGASDLSDDPKNQAENVMIVDLLRNDLSRISLPGTVSVPSLFEVARHGDVLQMTSTVQGQIKPETALADVLQAVFPCGSVTGAPKKRSMQIIQELEAQDREYYCGALGWLDPDGDFAFSVPIRTIEIEEDPQSHSNTFTLGVGAGITIDSDAAQEWEECRIKSAFLMDLPSAVGIFETIALKNASPLNLSAHLDRMQSSACALGISFDRSVANTRVLDACNNLDVNHVYRLRLDLSMDGHFSCTIGPLDVLHDSVKIFWATDILQGDCLMYSGDPLLQHKVSKRALYDQAWQKSVELGGFDALFLNEQGFVTEGGRSSIFIRPKDSKQWLTPPLSAGLLPGVMRANLLADPLLNAREANLTIKDVSMAEEIMLTNALRGAIQAHF
ncbi:bifunctional chorismate-binding protein/class IV aminotransferase [Polynucleobacter sp. AP-Latsch-80-C2]|jgi:para-aminobenzoate synthetase/4-amino-4-deoxychorismate lyase|uniref:bifunctional chorismate-binding protein/class IV aminotransferase n=1 Tax=Polynucleobacter sp. AP-Latsch-80-C2 TaxID=2576931 RepID=UPI001C0E061C|nr:bifunctional chorismate-binding protein/class IV aminotransferase [Polynucleobacter sp. AP-Latsch-80-C2]MBU3622387.1 chorismate-binding protein [Polynucleobacter sp. AP-Latsch-80-C2]